MPVRVGMVMVINPKAAGNTNEWASVGLCQYGQTCPGLTYANSAGGPKSVPKPPAKPSESPGPGWEWRGKGAPGSDNGSWYNPSTGESLHPDLNHPGPIGPHWDYVDPAGNQWRIPPGGGAPIAK
jgi:hypothetical protein